MRYYSLHRPVSVGTYPKDGVVAVYNFDDKQECKNIGLSAWGYIEYDRKLTDEEIKEYELFEAPIQSCTQKQLKAIHRIISRKQAKYAKDCVAGQLIEYDTYCITDGAVLVISQKAFAHTSYDDVHESSFKNIFMKEYDSYERYPATILETSDYPDPAKLRKIISEHKKDGKDTCKVGLKAKDKDGNSLIGFFNPKLLIDAIESVGSKPKCFLYKSHNGYAYFMVGSGKTLWDFEKGVHALVLLLRL